MRILRFEVVLSTVILPLAANASTMFLDNSQKVFGIDQQHEQVQYPVNTTIDSDNTRVRLDSFPNHSLRVNRNDDSKLTGSSNAAADINATTTLCDHGLNQHTGYLDITDNELEKHLFFWYFEAKTKPAEKPLLLRLNGGPGCSSTTGLLFELGPCTIQRNSSETSPSLNSSTYTTVNLWSWARYANIIFLDQPVGVGFSYFSNSSRTSSNFGAAQDYPVSTSEEAAFDVYAFLQLFYSHFPGTKASEFHIAAESYGGHYAPHIGKVIWEKNKEVEVQQKKTGTKISRPRFEDRFNIPLTSIILADAITEPLSQWASMPEYYCNGPYPIWNRNSKECAKLKEKAEICLDLIKKCYACGQEENDACRLVCYAPVDYCNQHLVYRMIERGVNPYDIRKPCDRSPDKDGDHCYREMTWIEEWMDQESIKRAIGADPDIRYTGCNGKLGEAFVKRGDFMRNSAVLLVPILNDGIRLLGFSGNADGLVNVLGTFDWMFALEGHPYVNEFRNATTQPWFLPYVGSRAGDVRIAYGHGNGAVNGTSDVGVNGVGRYMYVNVHRAGHMAPYDQPEVTLDLIGRWLNNAPLIPTTA